MNVVFSPNGPSRLNLLVNGPIPPEPPILSVLPSFGVTCRTEDNLPPKLAGMPALYNSTPCTISEFTDEKNPNKCEGLNRVF